MWRLLLLLLVGTACAQESGDYEQENDDQLIKVAANEDNFYKSFDEYYNEDEMDEEDLSFSQYSDHSDPDFTEKGEHAACPDKGTSKYHIFEESTGFYAANDFCRSHSGDLSSVHSLDKNNDLQRLLKESVKNTKNVWLGVWKKDLISQYRNIDGSDLDYVNWGKGQRKLIGEWCVAMNTNSGRWVSHKCNTSIFPFVCTY